MNICALCLLYCYHKMAFPTASGDHPASFILCCSIQAALVRRHRLCACKRPGRLSVIAVLDSSSISARLQGFCGVFSLRTLLQRPGFAKLCAFQSFVRGSVDLQRCGSSTAAGGSIVHQQQPSSDIPASAVLLHVFL